MTKIYNKTEDLIRKRSVIMSKYKVGDEIKIREDLKFGDYYGKGIAVNGFMARYKGRTGKITGKVHEDTYRINADNGRWVWTDEMFEESVELKEEINMLKYKVGDVVKIKGDLKIGDGKWGCTAVEDMVEYRGKTAKIVVCDDYDRDYKIDIDGKQWYWCDEMFEEGYKEVFIEEIISNLHLVPTENIMTELKKRFDV